MWDNLPVWIELRAAAHWLMRFVATEGSRQIQFSDEAMTDSMSDEDLRLLAVSNGYCLEYYHYH